MHLEDHLACNQTFKNRFDITIYKDEEKNRFRKLKNKTMKN